MKQNKSELLSVVVPVFNESGSILEFNKQLFDTLEKLDIETEVIYIDDGSVDDSVSHIKSLHEPNIKLVSLSRNFGKEIALSAGIAEAKGDAILMIDADGQHPVELIPRFLDEWRKGSKVIIGVRTNEKDNSSFNAFSSQIFYKLFNLFSDQKLIPGSTDYRLIDRAVADEFKSISEPDRMTRLLIDWIGFKRTYIQFKAKVRIHGKPTYSKKLLLKLALDSIVSMTQAPLYLFAYLGIFISILSGFFGLIIFIEQILLNDPLSWNFTGTALLGILIIFLVGIVLMSQGIMSLYIAKIFNQSKGRPLYVVDHERSVGIVSKKIS